MPRLQFPFETPGFPAAGVAVLLALALAGGCGPKVAKMALGPNQRPILTLTQYPSQTGDPYFYAYEVRWSAYDPDGRVDHYLYAVDPAPDDTTWVRTTANRQVLSFRSTTAEPGANPLVLTDPHVFVLKAVDDRGDDSEPVIRAFFSFTVAPTCQIVTPKPNHLLQPQVPPTVTIRWTGTDPDGQHGTQPIKYKFKLFSQAGNEFPYNLAVSRPDSLRNFYAPEFASWDSVGGDTTVATFANLVPGQNYLFVVVAFDEVGGYSAAFTTDVNMLMFYVGFAGVLGPKITIGNQYFNYTYASGGYNADPTAWVSLEVPANAPIQFTWSALPTGGALMQGFRWAMDIVNLDDDTRRTDEFTDLKHWSRLSLNTTTATIGPFTGGQPGDPPEQHLFYLEARDNNNLKSLAVIYLTVVRPSFTKDLLVVNDTRVPVDKSDLHGCVTRSSGVWPSSAELDTFLFARGGKPWRCYQAGTQSPPGILAGYRFDTLMTRCQRGGIVPLSTLAQYRHVIWEADLKGVINVNAPGYPINPMSTLRFTSRAGQANQLGTYAGMGGQVWVMGGGAAAATQVDWERGGPSDYFSFDDGELGPGRFMWEYSHWRSEIGVQQAEIALRSPAARGGWTGAPNYSDLPDRLDPKDGSVDPLPPQRQPSEFYLLIYNVEFISRPNNITVDANPDPLVDDLYSVLDTLYIAGGGSPQSDQQPVMTLYHGPDCGPMVFSGFPLWYFQRPQAMALADFVLQEVWGLTRAPVPREPALVAVPGGGSARPGMAPGAGRALPRLPASEMVAHPRGLLLHP